MVVVSTVLAYPQRLDFAEELARGPSHLLTLEVDPGD